MSAKYVRNYYRVDYKRGDRLVLRTPTAERHGVLVSFPDHPGPSRLSS